MKYSTFIWFLLISTAACGDDSGAAKSVFVPTDAGTDVSVDQLACEFTDRACQLTCDVLVDPSFCWNIALTEANACGDSSVRGVLSVDGRSCTSAETVVRFDAPVIVPEVPERGAWGIEISRDGSTCLEIDDRPTSLSVASASGKVTVSLTAEPELYRIECPDGSAWESHDSVALLACKDAEGLTTLPGISTVTIGDDFQFGLLPGPDSLVRCGP